MLIKYIQTHINIYTKLQYVCIFMHNLCISMHIYAYLCTIFMKRGPGPGPLFMNIMHKYAYMCMHMHNLCMNNLLWYLLWYLLGTFLINTPKFHEI